VNLCDETGETEIMVDNDDQGREKALEMTIEELDLSVRSFNCLKRAWHQHCRRPHQQERG